MQKYLGSAFILWLLLFPFFLFAQHEGRFGFEYNEGGFWISPHHQNLLDTLAGTGAMGGDINVNQVGGGWDGMQSGPGVEPDFSVSDQIVSLFQTRGFSLAWNVRCNAAWAFPGKAHCQPDFPGLAVKDCAPDPQFEQEWIDYITKLVERYDGDGIDDMNGLTIPIRTYILTGEVKFGTRGGGDTEEGPFWYDNIDNLLRWHRITYQAIHAADTSGNVKVISSGGLLSDLYADFPDYPAFDPEDPTSQIRQRLSGINFSGNLFTAGWDSLKKMLNSFGDDSDGIEADYIGWHPHFGWRIIDQEFNLIRSLTGNKPVYVDDMWTNVFAEGRGVFGQALPGRMQFTAPPDANAGTAWITNAYGDFPNELFTGSDPHQVLREGLQNGDPAILKWFYGNGAREAVKAFSSAFGEGAVIVNYSGSNDLQFFRNTAPVIGWINLVGTKEEGYPKKPQYYAYRQLVEKLNDFSLAEEIPVGTGPRTRVYRFERPARGPVLVAWSETGPPPPGLDYSIANGETVTIPVSAQQMLLTHVISDSINPTPQLDTLTASNGELTIQLGHSPIFLESLDAVAINLPASNNPKSFALLQNFPNPFNPQTVIPYYLPKRTHVALKIFDLLGREIATLVDQSQHNGTHQAKWDGRDSSGKIAASGVYLYRIRAGEFIENRKMLLLH